LRGPVPAPAAATRPPEAASAERAHLHDDGLPAAALHVDLLSARDEQIAQVCLELCVGGLQIKQRLRHLLLKVVGLLHAIIEGGHAMRACIA